MCNGLQLLLQYPCVYQDLISRRSGRNGRGAVGMGTEDEPGGGGGVERDPTAAVRQHAAVDERARKTLAAAVCQCRVSRAAAPRLRWVLRLVKLRSRDGGVRIDVGWSGGSLYVALHTHDAARGYAYTSYTPSPHSMWRQASHISLAHLMQEDALLEDLDGQLAALRPRVLDHRRRGGPARPKPQVESVDERDGRRSRWRAGRWRR